MNDLNIVVIGSVTTTERTIKGLLRHDFNIAGILGYEPIDPAKVSGLVNLNKIARSNDIDYKGFQKINDSENLLWGKERKPDIIFAVGFSQLLGDEWLGMATMGCVGFHPTCLPQGRGRAPIAWIILEERQGAATFFLMGPGADDGPIFVQKEFEVTQHDDASSIEEKISLGIDEALDDWLPSLRNGEWDPVPQDELKASWYGKRSIEDGLINWEMDAEEIDLLIKASCKPHPGAYSFLNRQKIEIYSAEVEKSIPIKGTVGRILQVDDSKGYLVQCGRGLIWINNLGLPKCLRLKIGDRFGFLIQQEIFELWERLEQLNGKE